mmetsp:Transcript_50683/g.121020  ORF Transcript_50683/g.121020 Transcript_50683/m.121020 type:complete len:377 (-) Transcript_50683:226-1356(-)
MAPGTSIDSKRPACNEKVEVWVRQRHLEAHKQKVARSRSLINNQWSVREETKLQPTRFRNAKKEQLAEERYSSIEKENRRLLTRMQEIERKGSQKAVASLVLGATGSTATRQVSQGPAGSRVSARVRELKRIDEENQRLLKRLQSTKAAVNMSKLDQEHKVQQRYMKMRCEHQKEDWLLERAHEQSLLAAHMAVRAASKAVAGPVSKEPPGPTDAECIRLLHLQDRFRSRAEADEDLSPMDSEEARKELPGSASPASDRAAEEGNCESQARNGPRQKPRLIGEYAGHLPDSSHNLVEQLMAQYAQLQEQEEEDTEAAAEEAKAAAAAAFRKAEALDVASDDAMLNYEKVVRSRLNREAASLVCVEDLDSFVVDPAP